MAPTLIYFPIPARAEVARLLLTVGKVDFNVSGDLLGTAADSTIEADRATLQHSQSDNYRFCIVLVCCKDRRSLECKSWPALTAATGLTTLCNPCRISNLCCLSTAGQACGWG